MPSCLLARVDDEIRKVYESGRRPTRIHISYPGYLLLLRESRAFMVLKRWEHPSSGLLLSKYQGIIVEPRLEPKKLVIDSEVVV